MKLNRKQSKLIEAIFAVPTRANIKFADIEKLLVSCGAEKFESSGSRVAFYMGNGLKWEAHKPHPQKEARKYQIESLRDFIEEAGITDE